MEIYETKYGIVKCFADTIEDSAKTQMLEMSNSILGEDANIRFMPDCHAGKGCVIGTTMLIKDKVCPNLVGVDISCSVSLLKTDLDLKDMLDKLDDLIKKYVPSGRSVHNVPTIEYEFFEQLKCAEHLSRNNIKKATHSLGTLGGGNHFIEAYEDGYISVHTGSRNIGLLVAEYYQALAEERSKEMNY
jgi:RNA-splicing ligase RtcB